jgi:hypothetical protein
VSEVGYGAGPRPGGGLGAEGDGAAQGEKAEPGPDAGHFPGAAAEAPLAESPVPLGVVLRPTGNAEVDEAVARLADADELPTGGHVEVYEDVHRGLRDALTALDENRS